MFLTLGHKDASTRSCLLKPQKILHLCRTALKVLIRLTWRIFFYKTGRRWQNMNIFRVFTSKTLIALVTWTGKNQLVPTRGMVTNYNQQDTTCILPKSFILYSYSIFIVGFVHRGPILVRPDTQSSLLKTCYNVVLWNSRFGWA